MSIKKSIFASGLPFSGKLIELSEQGKLPDSMVRYGIRRLCKKRLKDEFIGHPEHQQDRFQTLIEELRMSPIAIETDAANEQHYEVATDFYLASLGKRLKYSCAYYPDSSTTLDQAEEEMLALYSKRAELDNDQVILELGCGWGSLTLWMAENYPRSKITAVSNSSSQKSYIDKLCRKAGFSNVTVITADVNFLELESAQFDRVISIEMFEHMRNHDLLFERIAGWLEPEGKLFFQIFCHQAFPYFFESESESDWLAANFFSGGMMPSWDLPLQFQAHLSLEDRWPVNGTHYAQTCAAWLVYCDQFKPQILEIFVHSPDPRPPIIQFNRWRMFFMASETLFAYNQGHEWFVGHYLFSKQQPDRTATKTA